MPRQEPSGRGEQVLIAGVLIAMTIGIGILVVLAVFFLKLALGVEP